MPRANGWLDIHAHFTPPTTPEDRARQWRSLRETSFLAKEPYHWTPESALATMDHLGIAMQMLSPIPLAADLPVMRGWNDYGARLVADHPDRFGLLVGLPIDDPAAALAEIERGDTETHPDGYLVTTQRAGVPLGDERLRPVWEELDNRGAVVFVHPGTHIAPVLRQPTVLLELPFETCRAVVDLLYTGFFRRYPRLRMVLAHCGGALPGLSGRLKLLGAQQWVPNPESLTAEEIDTHLSKLYLDTAAAGMDANLAAALTMVDRDHLVYGGDSGVPCSDDASMGRNIEALGESPVLRPGEADNIGRRGFELFPAAARRRSLAAASM
jgi:6-methylsalicylate decarboxylase